MPTIEPTNEVWDLFDYEKLIMQILSLHNIENPIIICHSFGFRVATILKEKIKIKKIIVTGGAGPKKSSILKKIEQQNNSITKIMIKALYPILVNQYRFCLFVQEFLHLI